MRSHRPTVLKVSTSHMPRTALFLIRGSARSRCRAPMPLLTTSSFNLRPRTIVRGGTHNSFLSVMHLTRVGLPIYRATVVSRRMSPQLRRRAWRQFDGGGVWPTWLTRVEIMPLDPDEKKKKMSRAKWWARAKRKVRNVMYGDVGKGGIA